MLLHAAGRRRGGIRVATLVVIGANLAGGRAVETLRQEGFDGRVVLVGDEPDRPYERPPLSKQVLRSEAEPSSVFLREESWYAEHDVDLALGRRAVRLDPEVRRIVLDDGEELGYDSCLLATGGRPRILEVPGAGLDGVRYLRTLADATALAAALREQPRVVVIGAGFIGAEVAASARAAGCPTTMLELLDLPLVRVLGEQVGRVYAEIHADHGVELRLGEGVERFDGDGRVEAVVGASGRVYPADLVVVGVGMVPNVELAERAGAEVADGIVVDDRCRTSLPGVFAAGDVARRPDAYSGGSIRVEHFQNAANQGPAAARNMLGRDEAFQEVPWFWSDQYDVNLQMAGHPPADGQRVVRGDIAAREFVCFTLAGGRVASAVGLNAGRDIAVARRLIERGVAVDAQTLADPGVNLRDLLRA